ncbi:MAG: MgtC/SapB family protein [Sporomusa sp.]
MELGLGAGAILKDGLTVRGLTTAASLWVVAAIGLAVGSGYYIAVVATAALSIAAFNVLPRIEPLYDIHCEACIVAKSEDKPGQIGKMVSFLSSIRVQILDIKIETLPDKQVLMTFLLNCPNKRIISDIISNLSVMDGIISVTQEKQRKLAIWG